MLFRLIPIPSIVTPAALTVATASLDPVPTEMLRVPQIDFLSLNFATLISCSTSGGLWCYVGPQNTVNKIVAATVAQGSILPITYSPPAPNSSWTLEFPGPSLNCTDLECSALDAVNRNIQVAVGINNCTTSFGYIGWTPAYSYPGGPANYGLQNLTKLASTLPFIISPDNASYIFQDGFTDNSRSTTFFTATSEMTNFPSQLDPDTCTPETNPSMQAANPLPNATVLQCVLYNSSYKVDFSFLNGQQTINVTVDPTPYNPFIIYTNYMGATDSPFTNYTASANGTSIVDFWNTAAVRAVSYKSIMDSFSRIVVGTIYNSAFTPGLVYTNETSILSTVLSETRELAGLTNQNNTLQSQSQQSPGVYWNGVDSVENSPTIPLKDALESIFQNITIGLMSSQLLQYVHFCSKLNSQQRRLIQRRPNISSPYTPSNVSISLPKYQTVYVYTPTKLWTPYGLAILFTTISVAIGLYAMVSNGAAYTNHFSTILRTTRFANIDPDVLPENGDGKDPMPNHLARAVVSFSADGIEMRRRGWLGDSATSIVTKRLLPNS
jgi:hypothetical protein